jgi:hypothetical protein
VLITDQESEYLRLISFFGEIQITTDIQNLTRLVLRQVRKPVEITQKVTVLFLGHSLFLFRILIQTLIASALLKMRQSLFKSQNPRIFPALYSIPSLMATEEYKPFWTEFIAGWAGGIGLVLAGQPFDLLKVRLQTNGAKYNNSLVKCAQEVISKEGLGSFYKGTASPLVGIGIINSIQFGVYQNCKEWVETLLSRTCSFREWQPASRQDSW